MSPKIITKFLSKPLFKQFIKFGIVGAIGTLINIAILYSLTEYIDIYYIISEIIAFFVAGLNNYIWNKLWTFKEKIKDQVVSKYVQFIVISLISLFVNISTLYVLVEYFKFWYVLAEVVAIVIAFLLNFIGNKVWTFRSKDTDSSSENNK